MDISKHPILKQGHDLVQAIEECGCSEKLTAMVILACAYNEAVEKLVDEINGKNIEHTDIEKYY